MGEPIKSNTLLCPKPRIFGRGGRRSRPARQSNLIDQRSADLLLRVIHDSMASRTPLNRFITIHWERAGIVPGPMAAKATARFLKLARDWLRSRGHPFAYVWVRENDYGDGTKGDHVHILCHVPAGISFAGRQGQWLRITTGARYRAGVIRTRRIGGSAATCLTDPDHYRANLAALSDYVLKGASRPAAQALGLGRWGEGGHVTGQRWAISRTLSAGVRYGQVC